MITNNRTFYRSFFHMLLFVALQNVVSYSVNVADNIMLGSYSQAALSGASTVNQLHFLIQQITTSIGDSMVMLSSQYWGKQELGPIRSLAGIALKVGTGFMVGILLLTTLLPRQFLMIFTSDPEILAAGLEYLSVLRFTYLFYIFTTILLAALRSVETVNIAFLVSVVSLVINVSINYTLIFGRFGFPEMGIRGAAIGTLVARAAEFIIVFSFVMKWDKKLRLFSENPFRKNAVLRTDYRRVAVPVVSTNLLWSLATPIQTGILGHLSADAIAANSVSTTMFQYMKVVTISAASSTSVLMGRTIGSGFRTKEQLRPYVIRMQGLFLLLGVSLGMLLYFIRTPLLSLYALNPSALGLADQLMRLMVLIFIGMAYQMPVSVGIIRGGGDTRFTMYVNVISSWLIVIPLSFAAAFWWKLPVFWVVFCLNSDQLFKCIPYAVYANSYRWIHVLVRESPDSSG